MSFNKKIAQFYNSTLLFYEWLLFFFFQKARKKVAEKINSLEGNTLDIGCHQGQLARLLKPTVTYHGIDIAQKAIKKANKKNRNAQHSFEQIDAEAFLQKRKHFKNYALLYFLSVCENPDRTILEIASNSRKNDRLFIVNHFSNNKTLGKIQSWVNKHLYLGFQFYFPMNLDLMEKHYNIVEQKNINWLWTYLHLERK